MSTLPALRAVIPVPHIAAEPTPPPPDAPRHLPRMDPDKVPPELGNAADFTRSAGLSHLDDYADALDVDIIPSQGTDRTHHLDRFKSIPTPWARLLFFEHA